MKAIIRLSTSEITSRKAMLSFSFRPPFNLNERYLQSRVYAANGKDCIMSIVNILQSRVYAANIFTAFAEKTGYLQSRVYAANGSDPDYSIRVALQSRVYAANILACSRF